MSDNSASDTQVVLSILNNLTSINDQANRFTLNINDSIEKSKQDAEKISELIKIKKYELDQLENL